MTAQNTSPCVQNPGAPNPWPNPGIANAGIIQLGNMGQPAVFSISLWVNPNAVQNGQSILLDGSHGGNANWVIQSINAGLTWVFLGCEYALQPGVWQHLLCTYDNGLSRVYINGNLVDEANWNINWVGAPNVYLGNWPEGGRRFGGLVDEVYITNNLLYNANFTPLEQIQNSAILPNTLGLWHFDEGVGLETQNAVNQVNTALNNWVWQARPLTLQSTGPKYSYDIASELLQLGGPTPTKLLFGSGSARINLKFPSQSGTLATEPTSFTSPVGTVDYYLGATIPNGYLKSHGQNVSRTDYASLYSTIGTTYGAGNGSTTFALPNLHSIPTNGLVGWWPFNGNANDESGSGFNGVVNGSVLAADRFGYNQSAYTFDGNDWIEVADNAALNPVAGTVSMWFKTALARVQEIIYKTAKFTALNENYGIAWNEDPNRTIEGGVKFQSGCKAGVGWQDAMPGKTYADDKWHHIIMTWGDGFVRLYVDGLLAAEKATPVNAADICAGGPLIIGGGWYAPIGTFIGLIDDVAIYNRILTESERAQLYGAESSRIVPVVKH
jgi:hypothetical protein